MDEARPSCPATRIATTTFEIPEGALMSIRSGFAAFLVATVLAPALFAQFQGDFNRFIPMADPRGQVAGDFDGDTFQDVITVDAAGDVWLLRTLGAGRPGAPMRLGAGLASTSWLAAADLDGDTDLDLIMGGRRAPGAGVTLPNPPIPLPPLPPAPFDRLLVGINDGSGSFTWSHAQLPFYGNGIDGRLGDADGDLDLDLFLLTESGITVMLNDGAGAFAHAGDYAKTDPLLFPSTGAGAIVADGTTRLDIGDFDGDGAADVAVINNRIRVVDFTQFPFLQEYPLNLVTVHLNDGAGALTIGAQVATGPNAKRIVVADFNGDARDDFAVLLPGQMQASDPGGIEVFLNNNAGGFMGSASSSNFTPWELISGDFDGNGSVDLATIGYNQFLTGMLPLPAGFQVDVTLHANDGGGGFASSALHGRATAALLPRAADFDGDGVLDLCALSCTDGRIEARFMYSMPRSFPIEPGTGDDLVLATGVNGGTPTGTPPEDVKIIGPGQPATAVATSPSGTFVGEPLYLFIGFGLFEWAANPVAGTFQILEFPFWEIIALGPVPTSGSLVMTTNAPALIGFNFYVQFGVVSPLASNGQYAVTDGHVIRVR
jgi:hypothetical protein